MKVRVQIHVALRDSSIWWGFEPIINDTAVSISITIICEMIDDDEWEPSVKDIKQILKDNKDDEELEDEVEDEDDYSIKDEGDGFISLK